MITKFIEENEYLQQLASMSSGDFVKNIMKGAKMYNFNRGVYVCQNGQRIEDFYMLIEGNVAIISPLMNSLVKNKPAEVSSFD